MPAKGHCDEHPVPRRIHRPLGPPRSGCPDQYEAATRDSVWSEMILSDPVGATWGSGVRRAPRVTMWGWTAALVAENANPNAAGCRRARQRGQSRSCKGALTPIWAHRRRYLSTSPVLRITPCGKRITCCCSRRRSNGSRREAVQGKQRRNASTRLLILPPPLGYLSAHDAGGSTSRCGSRLDSPFTPDGRTRRRLSGNIPETLHLEIVLRTGPRQTGSHVAK